MRMEASELKDLETRLWAAADQLWANTGLKPSEFSTPVLGLIFLRYAEKRFAEKQPPGIGIGGQRDPDIRRCLLKAGKETPAG